MEASSENNWYGMGSQAAWDNLPSENRMLKAMENGFQSVNARLNDGFQGVNARLDKITAATCPHLIDGLEFPYKVFSFNAELNHSSDSRGVWTVVRYQEKIYAMSALHVPLVPFSGNFVFKSSNKLFEYMCFPQYIIEHLKDKNNVNILVTAGTVQKQHLFKIKDDFIMVELMDFHLEHGKQALEVTPESLNCKQSSLTVAQPARGIVSVSHPERLDYKDGHLYTLSSQILQNGDSGATVWIKNDHEPFSFLGIYVGEGTMGSANQKHHMVIPMPNNLVSISGKLFDESKGHVKLGEFVYWPGKNTTPHLNSQTDLGWFGWRRWNLGSKF